MKHSFIYRSMAAVCVVMAICLGMSGCGTARLPGSAVSSESAAHSQDADAAALEIVCTMFPQYDLIRAIGGARVHAELLVLPGMEAHGFAPTVQNMAAAGQADLLILTGGDSDEWAETILENIDTDKTQTLTLLSCLKEGETYADDHIWASPRKCLQLIDGLSAALCALDAEGAPLYRANAAAYRARFEALDVDFSALGQAVAKPILLGDRQPFACLAEDYGLRFAAAFHGCGTDTEVSAEAMASLTDLAAAERISTVFYLELSDPALCHTLAEASGAQAKQLYSGQAISPQDYAAGLALADMLAYNLAAMTEAQA